MPTIAYIPDMDKIIHIRVRADENAAFARAAERDGRTLSGWARHILKVASAASITAILPNLDAPSYLSTPGTVADRMGRVANDGRIMTRTAGLVDRGLIYIQRSELARAIHFGWEEVKYEPQLNDLVVVKKNT